MKDFKFAKLVYGKVLFNEAFWDALRIFFISKTRKERAAACVDLLPYSEELKRIFTDGSTKEREAVKMEIEKTRLEGDIKREAAWRVFMGEFFPEKGERSNGLPLLKLLPGAWAKKKGSQAAGEPPYCSGFHD